MSGTAATVARSRSSPRAAWSARMAKNLDVFDLELTEGGCERIRGHDGGKPIVLDCHDLGMVQLLLECTKGQIDAAG